MNREPETVVVNVFTEQGGGGNPCPIVLDATGMTEADMQAMAQRHGLECAFLFPTDGAAPYRLRYFVPTREMEMCGHATLGTGWLLRMRGLAAPTLITVQTLAGEVTIDMRAARIRIGQPGATVQPVEAGYIDDILRVLGIRPSDLATPLICNASTSRPKTIIHIASTDILNALAPRFDEMRDLCGRIGSTGLYPFAVSQDAAFTYEARQFPQSSGYHEDAATGIAATALFGALGHYGIEIPRGVTANVLQGRAMGRLSRMCVTMEDPPHGASRAPCTYWLSGEVTEQAP